MGDTPSSESPLEAVTQTVGERTTEAFEILGNDTRLAILLAFWEAHDPFEQKTAVPFSELYDRVDIGDTGNFTYHLDKLTGHFVEKTEEGYELREAGFRIVQAVIAGVGLDEPSLERTEIDTPCYRCGAPVEIMYEDGHLYRLCTECEGGFGSEFDHDFPTGTLALTPLPPASLSDRTAEDVFTAQKIASISSLESYIRGVCPECAGAVDESLRICESHEVPPGEVCPACGTIDEVKVRYVCAVCKSAGTWPADAAAHLHPAVDRFCHEQGLDLQLDADDPEGCIRTHQHHGARDYTLVSTDPVRLDVTVPGPDATLHLSLDGDLNVVDVTEKIEERD